MKKRSMIAALLAAASLSMNAQRADVAVKSGPFTADYNSLGAWECPEWFKDAKFGIWAHWGPQCHAEAGDWYARFMYFEGTGANQWHWNHFGNPEEFGLKDLCNDWKAQKWDAESLVNLYKSAGARYFMALGNHHDNFDLWNSPYQEWNSVNVGPKKDIVKGWSDACKKAGLPLGVSIHASHAWTWLEPSQDYDGNLTKEDGYKPNPDGKEKWWKGMDPQELYAQRHTPSRGWEASGNIHSQWDWGNGASLPSEEYKKKFQNRVLELIDDYAPDMIYFDDTAMPFYGCDDEIGKNILTHYYNSSAAKTGGKPDVVVTGKQLTKDQKQYMMWDVERGIPDKIQDTYWQTCTCIGDWHYNQSVYNNSGYKSAQQVVDMLVDIISKNGNLLLSIPVKSDGTIDDKEMKVVEGIKAWMDINAKSVYGTRPWKTFGEGPLAESANALSAQGFNEGNKYSARDVRYVQRNDTLFATVMRWPASQTFSFESLSLASEFYSGKVASVELLGYGKVNYTETVSGLTVDVPATRPNEIAPVYQITFDSSSVVEPTLQDVIDAYEASVRELYASASYNTGKYSKDAIANFMKVVEDAKQYTSSSETTQKTLIKSINAAYRKFKSEGRNAAGAPENAENATDMTREQLIEASKFSASDVGSRFGTPMYWTVENFNIPMLDPSKGNKNGIDAYPGCNTLSLGVWSGEDGTTTNDISNARIYRTVHLEPGRYFFGTRLQTIYNMNVAYIYAADKALDNDVLEDECIAFGDLTKGNTGGFYGINFTIKEEQDVVLAFQADLTTATQQEFRIQDVKLLYYGNMDYDALNNLIMSADRIIEEAQVNSNTGYYRKEAVEKLTEAMHAAEEIDDNVSMEEFTEAYNALQQAINDFHENGRNMGGAPIGTYEDVTETYLHESKDFRRTADTADGDRFGAPEYWSVDNFGFGDQRGIDGLNGYDCLHLEVWWNSNAFPENGYDISNVRLYQLADLPAGRYFFGASYPTSEPNEELYIFASQKLVDTKDIATQTLAYEKVKLAPTDGSYRGIYFTLEDDASVYLGWQADFTGMQTNNLRAAGVKLLYYGEISYGKLSELIKDIEQNMDSYKLNENTGFYSLEAGEKLIAVIEEAKKLDSSADYDAISDAYTKLNDAYNDFIQNGKNKGGKASLIDAVDITEDKLVEASEFTRADKTVTSRFTSPMYWTVENYDIPSSSEGLRGGLDKYPGYDCLTLGVWDDKGNAPAESDIQNARVYRKVNLDAGRYFFGAVYNTIYNLKDAYIFAASETMETADISSESIAYMKISESSADGNCWGIYFTLPESQEVLLGWQDDILNGNNTQEFRVQKVQLLKYGADEPDAIISTEMDTTAEGPVEIYSLQGTKLTSIPSRGIFIIKQGNKVSKYCVK